MPTFDRPRSKAFIEGYLQAVYITEALVKDAALSTSLLRVTELHKVHAQNAKIMREHGLEPADETSGALYFYEEARDLLIEMGPKGLAFRFDDWVEMRKHIADSRRFALE